MAGAGSLASGMISGIGNAVGARAALGELNDAKSDYNKKMETGIQTQQQGLDQANAAYQPYTAAAQSGLAGYTGDINGRQQAQGPSLGSYDPNAYLNPSAAYTTSQANTAAQSSSLAHGGLGGGLGKALSNNANKMAMTNYNEAYQKMLDTNAQKFNQGQQLYTNATDYQQQQIANKGNAATLALQGLSAGSQVASGYRGNISNLYGNMAATALDIGQNKAGLAYGAINSATNSSGGGLGSYTNSLKATPPGAGGGGAAVGTTDARNAIPGDSEDMLA